MCEYENCRLLLVDKKISTARDMVHILEEAIRGGYPIMVMAEDIEQEALATLVVNKLRGNLKVRADSTFCCPPQAQVSLPSCQVFVCHQKALKQSGHPLASCRLLPSRLPASVSARPATSRTLPSSPAAPSSVTRLA